MSDLNCLQDAEQMGIAEHPKKKVGMLILCFNSFFMKKLMFSAVAVLAVVGSAFAFSSRSSEQLFCQDPAQGITTCTVLKTSVTYTNRGLGTQPFKCNTVSSATCLAPQVFIGL